MGNDVNLAGGVTILAHDAILCEHGGELLRARVVIGDKIFIGANSIYCLV